MGEKKDELGRGGGDDDGSSLLPEESECGKTSENFFFSLRQEFLE
jgi:hypothetical protein